MNIWKNDIRPSFWLWWWESPLSKGIQRIKLFIIMALILGIVFLHPFFPYTAGHVHWPLLTVFLFILIVTLILPQIERIKTSEFEIELIPPVTLGPVLSPLKLEESLKGQAQTRRDLFLSI